MSFRLTCYREPFFAHILHKSLFVIRIDTFNLVATHDNIAHNPSDIAFISDSELIIICNRTYYLIYDIKLKEITKYCDFTHTLHQALPPLHDYLLLLFKYPYGNIRHVYDANILITTDKKKAVIMNLRSHEEKKINIEIYHYSLIYADDKYIAIYPSTKNDNIVSVFSLSTLKSCKFSLQKESLQVNIVIVDNCIAIKSVYVEYQIDPIAKNNVFKTTTYITTYSTTGEKLGEYKIMLQDGKIKKMDNMILLIFPKKITVLNKTCQTFAENDVSQYMTNNDHFIVCYNDNKINMYNKFLQHIASVDSGLVKSAHICSTSLLLFDGHNKAVVKKNILCKQYLVMHQQEHDSETTENKTFALLGGMLHTHSKINMDDVLYDAMSYLTK